MHRSVHFFSKIRTLSTQEAEKDDTILAAIRGTIDAARPKAGQADHSSTDTSDTRRKIAEIIIDSVIGSTGANIADRGSQALPPPPLISSQQPNTDAQVQEFKILLKQAYDQRHDSVIKKFFRGRGRNPQSGKDYEDSISQQLQTHAGNLEDKIKTLERMIERNEAHGLSKKAVNSKLENSNSTSLRTARGR